MGWKTADITPIDRELELAVINGDDVYKLAFPCRRVPGGWLNCKSRRWVDVYPTHWRDWSGSEPRLSNRIAN